MKIKWFGQSCFLITAENGAKVLTDPFKNMLGYKLPEIEADIVTTSHDHADHNNINAVKGRFTHIQKAGAYLENGISIQGVATFHDKVSGAKRGKNTVYNFSIDGINVCHLGDLGHLLDSKQLAAIGKVDIILLPVGGGPTTIGAADAIEVVQQLDPAMVIPMHYRTKALWVFGFLFEKVDKFIAASNLKAQKCKELEINKENIKKYQDKEIVVLEYE
ncbi:MAG TPA: MBL fold metallo-hydrolase [Firmicutes bacterium]|nr:MBL fold metallo-hydrolase [Bacillota bacterium]